MSDNRSDLTVSLVSEAFRPGILAFFLGEPSVLPVQSAEFTRIIHTCKVDLHTRSITVLHASSSASSALQLLPLPWAHLQRCLHMDSFCSASSRFSSISLDQGPEQHMRPQSTSQKLFFLFSRTLLRQY